MKYRNLYSFRWFVLFSNLLLIVWPAEAIIYHVPADFATIPEAIAAASYGDEIVISSGTYTGHFEMKSGIKLIGTNVNTCLIVRDTCDNSPLISCENCDENTLIANLTITGAAGNACTNCCAPVGIQCVNSKVRIEDNRIISHYRRGMDGTFLIEYHGHGILIIEGAPVVVGNYFYNNRAYNLGAAIYIENANATIRSNVFRENMVFNWGPDVKGAGIGIESGAPIISNNVFYKNSISGNAPYPAGAGIYNFSTAPNIVIENNIFLDNSPDAANGVLHSFRYNCFWDNSVDTLSLGIGNIFNDPLFVNEQSDNFHLKECSPSIDAGNPQSDYSSEPLPNGVAINQGINGNTAEATISHLTTLGNDTSFCSGDELILDAGFGYGDYAWSNGAEEQFLLVNTAGDYAVTVSNGAGCSGMATVLVNSEEYVEPAIVIEADKIVICGGQAVNFSSSLSNEGSQPMLQWLINGVDTGEESPSFSTTTLGNDDVVQCKQTSSVACPTINPVLSNPITISKLPPYYHPFQNFDDDVDRIKTFTNFFGGNAGVINAGGLQLEYDTSETRTGYGRSMKIGFGPLINFHLYVESFERKWFDENTWLNLEELFPAYINPEFSSRKIDSIIFYGKLVAIEPFVLQVKLEDANGGESIVNRLVHPLPGWQRFSFALHDFEGDFDATAAKFIGLNFDSGLGQNFFNEGVFYLDDMYLVENCFQKPTFTDHSDMLAYLNEVNFRHFWMAIEPVSKFALERHVWDDLISVDAIGYQLASYVIAHKNGWINSNLIETRVNHILTYLLDSCEHTTNPALAITNPLDYASVNGVWAHFLDHNTLSRKDIGSNYDLYSTATLLAGALVAGAHFQWNDEIVTKANALFSMADWNFLRRPDNLLYYSWNPEAGYSGGGTDWFNERSDLAFLLGVSSPVPDFQLQANPFVLDGYQKPLCSDSTYIYTASGSNFNYQAMQVFARFGEETGRYQNARNALLADLAYCQNEYTNLAYNPLIFGTAACEGPDSAGIADIIGADTIYISNYHPYGYCCKYDGFNEGNGTVALYGSGTAAPFLPQEVKGLWNYYYNNLDELFWNDYAARFWSPIFGMPDAFHLAPDDALDTLINGLNFRSPWLSVPRFGADVGPMLMNIDSYLSESMGEPSVRDYFSEHPLISANLAQFAEIPPTGGALVPSVAISALSQSTCEGSPLLVSAVAEHGGDESVFEWFVDGVSVQSGSEVFYQLEFAAGSYELTCKMTSSDYCIAGSGAISNVLTFVIHPLPVPVIESNSPLCAGDTLLLEAEGGIFYDWSGPNNFHAMGANVKVPTFSSMASGSYSVSVSDMNGCTASTSEDVTVNPMPNALITADGPTVLCDGESVVLTASGGDIYTWSDGTDSASIVVTSGDLYIVTVSNANGCMATASQIVEVSSNPNAVIEFSSDTALCQGDLVMLTALGGNAFLWSTGDVSATIEVSESGIYSVTVTNINGCSDSDSVEVVFYDLPAVTLDEFDTVSMDTTPFILSGGNPPGGFYSGSGVFDSLVFDPAVAGVGEHEITYTFTNIDGCTGVASELLIVVEITALAEIFYQNELLIFPNPSSGRINLQSEYLSGGFLFTIYNSVGQVAYTQEVKFNGDTLLLALHNLSKGMYWLRLENEEIVILKKVVIQ